MSPLDRARATGREAVDIRMTKSGRMCVHLARPNGSGGSAEAATHAEAFVYVEIIRAELDSPKLDQRGPACDRRPE